MNDLPILFTVEQVAKILGVGRTTVFALIKNSEIESIKLGRRRRIPADAMQTYVDSLRSNCRSSEFNI